MKKAKTTIHIVNLVGSFVVVSLLVIYGEGNSTESIFHGALQLLLTTIKGENLFQNFYSVHMFEILNSLQLLTVSFLLALGTGIFLTIIQTSLKHRIMRALYDGLLTILESVPDAMYVVVFTITFLVLFEWYGINVPVFSESYHPSLAQTLFPALAISLPAGFYMRRLLTLRLEDELLGQYPIVARSKGNSWRRTLYRHILPNLGPIFLSILPSAMSIILSSVLFATYFFEYHDLYNRFTQAVGWVQNGGFRESGHIAGFVPTYQTGTVWLIGLSLVSIWALFVILQRVLSSRLFPIQRETTASYNMFRMRKVWIGAGTVIILGILFFGTFPQLVTPYTPNHIDYSTLEPFPLPISSKHPFGTDDVGRDLLALILYGTWKTILPAFSITFVVTVGSLILGLIASFSKSKFIGNVIRGISGIISSVPAFFVLFLILYPQNSRIAQGHSISVWRQVTVYLVAISVFEIGRGADAFFASFDEWRQFSFLEGVRAIGKSEFHAVFSNLRPWLTRFLLTFSFAELSRVLSLMTQLAAFRIFLSAKYDYLQFNYHVPPLKGVVPLYSNWFSTVGSVMNQFAFISYPYVLYYPLIFILALMLASNFIARGIRGGDL